MRGEINLAVRDDGPQGPTHPWELWADEGFSSSE